MESTVKAPGTPPKVTLVASRNSCPYSSTRVPGMPEVGRKLLNTVGGITRNCWLLVRMPPGAVTEIVPVVAAVGTVVAIAVALTTLNSVLTPPRETAVAPMNPVPVRVTGVPIGPESGLKLVRRTVGLASLRVMLQKQLSVLQVA